MRTSGGGRTFGGNEGCGAFVAGDAAIAAAGDAKEQLLQMAAQLLEALPGDLEVRDGRIYVAGSPEKFVTISQVARAHHFRPGGSVVLGRGFYDPPSQRPDSG